MKATLAGVGLALALLLGPAGQRRAAADQLIQIPTADRVPGPSAEYVQRVDGPGGYGTLLVPAGIAYEVMARYYHDFGGNRHVEGGGQFQLLPDGIVTPGVAIGIWDLSDDSPFGRRAFLVFTKSIEGGQFGLPRFFDRLQLTLGTGTGRFSGVLAGARMDLPAHFTLVAEFDARRFNAGLWYRATRALTLKAELQNGHPCVGGELQFRL